MRNDYLNSVNLNTGQDFPYLCMDVENGKSVPEPPGFHIMHWHEDFQFIYVLAGELYLHTLTQTKMVPTGQGVFLNKNVVHMVSASASCHYKSILFPEQLVSFYPGCPAAKYVKRIASCQQITCLQFDAANSWQERVLVRLKQLSEIDSAAAACYEYEVLTLLAAIWLELAQNISVPAAPVHDMVVHRMHIFLNYIKEHYAEAITLGDLAQSAMVSKSECLRCFKLSMQDTPYRYLLKYRLQMAAVLLTDSALPIGEVAQAVGFQSQSHFGKLFKEQTGYSPKDFRGKQK